jgi:hypothetical protein
MVAVQGRAGLRPVAAGAGFAPPTGPALGNDLPANTGYWARGDAAGHQRPGPGPATYSLPGGDLGNYDGTNAVDPRQPYRQPPGVQAWGEGDPGTTEEHQSFRRFGIQGFNDKLTVKDRHAYWDTGHQRTGLTFNAASANPNTYNNPAGVPPTAELRTVNRTVSYQMGSDATRNQDDLSRPYTWVGEQGSGWSSVWGGVPGLYTPYGSRGGVPYPVVDPTDGQGGSEDVWAGPPHGLHSLTYPDYGDTLNRYQATQQMVPGRLDRPANSPQAGQSYSQTVQAQGSTRPPAGPGGGRNPDLGRGLGRTWGGARRAPGR